MSAVEATKQTDEPLAEVVRRIVEVCDPDRIVLFGSTARGEATEHSDLDLLVLRRQFDDRSQTLIDIYNRLAGVSVGVDIVLATLDEAERYKETKFLVYHHALREGHEVYHG